MIYISQQDQLRIQRRVKRLPKVLRKQNFSILIFESISTLILTYGICISQYKHPISQKKPDPASDLFISCFFFFALSTSAPFTGGHMNPAVTITMNQIQKNTKILSYLIAQLFGALIGALLADWFFDTTPAPYIAHENIASCLLDCVGEIFGTMIFVFFILYITKTNYASGQYYGYLIISIMLLMGRTFTFRKACLNPAIGLIFQILASFQLNDYWLVLYSAPVIIGPIIGGLIAFNIFTKFYKPLLEQIQEDKIKQQHYQ